MTLDPNHHWDDADSYLSQSIDLIEAELRGEKVPNRQRIVRTFLPGWLRLDAILLAWVVVETILFSFLFVGQGSTNSHLGQLTHEDRSALCGYRAYLDNQISATEQYLATHTGKEPIPGITRAVLINGLAKQIAVRKTFEPVQCPR